MCKYFYAAVLSASLYYVYSQAVDVKYETLFPIVKADISRASHVAVTMDL